MILFCYGQDRFAQAFFNSSNGTSADGQIINNPDEIRAIAERCGVGNNWSLFEIDAWEKDFEI